MFARLYHANAMNFQSSVDIALCDITYTFEHVVCVCVYSANVLLQYKRMRMCRRSGLLYQSLLYHFFLFIVERPKYWTKYALILEILHLIYWLILLDLYRSSTWRIPRKWRVWGRWRHYIAGPWFISEARIGRWSTSMCDGKNILTVIRLDPFIGLGVQWTNGVDSHQIFTSISPSSYQNSASHTKNACSILPFEIKLNCFDFSISIWQNYINSILNDSTTKISNGTIPSWIPPNIYKYKGDKVLVKLLCGADLLESFATPGLWCEDDVCCIQIFRTTAAATAAAVTGEIDMLSLSLFFNFIRIFRLRPFSVSMVLLWYHEVEIIRNDSFSSRTC